MMDLMIGQKFISVDIGKVQQICREIIGLTCNVHDLNSDELLSIKQKIDDTKLSEYEKKIVLGRIQTPLLKHERFLMNIQIEKMAKQQEPKLKQMRSPQLMAPSITKNVHLIRSQQLKIEIEKVQEICRSILECKCNVFELNGDQLLAIKENAKNTKLSEQQQKIVLGRIETPLLQHDTYLINLQIENIRAKRKELWIQKSVHSIRSQQLKKIDMEKVQEICRSILELKCHIFELSADQLMSIKENVKNTKLSERQQKIVLDRIKMPLQQLNNDLMRLQIEKMRAKRKESKLHINIEKVEDACRKILSFEINAFDLSQGELINLKEYASQTKLSEAQRALVLGRIERPLQKFEAAKTHFKKEQIMNQIVHDNLRGRQNQKEDEIQLKSQPSKAKDSLNLLSQFFSLRGFSKLFGLSKQQSYEKVEQFDEQQSLFSQNTHQNILNSSMKKKK